MGASMLVISNGLCLLRVTGLGKETAA
jgi:hypothetical protein